MSTNRQFSKDPDVVTFFTVDWEPDIRSTETGVSSISWTVQEGLTKVSEGLSGSVATLWVSGGTSETNYAATCRATFDSGREEDWTIYIMCQDS